MHKISIIFVVVMGITFFGCNNSGNKKLDTDVVNNAKTASGDIKPYETPRITFKESEHDFGQIIQGELVKYTFKYTNTGQSDLLISKVSTSCGCTVPTYDKDPLPPGKSGELEVIFNSKGKKGFQNKTITVLANSTPNKTVLRIKANVVQPEKN